MPADRRWAGLDRRTIGPALFVLAFALLMRFGLPALDAAVTNEDPVRAGDVMALSNGVIFAPAPGWNITKGVRMGEEPGSGALTEARLTDGDVSYHVTVGPFSGSSRAQVEQIKKTTDVLSGKGDIHVTGDPVPVSTDSGLRGMLVHYSSPTSEGVLGAFAVNGTGIEIEATGVGDLSQQAVRDIAGMIASLRAEGNQTP